jgi:hypothetical protein
VSPHNQPSSVGTARVRIGRLTICVPLLDDLRLSTLASGRRFQCAGMPDVGRL